MKTAFIVGAMLVLLAGGASAGDIYRWVDDEGRTHMSDSVPEKYQARAKRYDSKSFEPADDAKREAQARARRDIEQAEAIARAKNAPPAATPASSPASVAQAGPEAKPETDCEQAWRQFVEQEVCYAPYHPRGAGVRGEGYAACGQPLREPAQRCGPRPRPPGGTM